MIIKDELQLTEAVLAETERADDPRFKEIVQALVRHLHDFAREVRLTEAEFDASLSIVARLGQLTTPSHNEVRLMAGSLGLSTLVCLMNNGTEEEPTSANLLGPFWRQGSPVMGNGDSIVRSPTEGPPLFFTGTVVDTAGQPGRRGRDRRLARLAGRPLREPGPRSGRVEPARQVLHRRQRGVRLPQRPAVGLSDPDNRAGRRSAERARPPPVPARARPRDGLQARLQDDHVADLQPRRPHARHRRPVRRHRPAHRELRAPRGRAGPGPGRGRALVHASTTPSSSSRARPGCRHRRSPPRPRKEWPISPSHSKYAINDPPMLIPTPSRALRRSAFGARMGSGNSAWSLLASAAAPAPA